MTPNSPAPDPEILRPAQARLKAAAKQREEGHAAVDREFWTAVRDEIAAGNLRQVDAAEALDVSREHIRRSLNKLAEDLKKLAPDAP
jgi:hypothetical protein